MGNMTTKELAQILNDDLAIMARRSAILKLSNAVLSGQVNKTRSYLSAFGKSKVGFDMIEKPILKMAIKIMEDNGFKPCGEFRTMSFTVRKIVKA